MRVLALLVAEVLTDARIHPTRWRLLALSACAALGSALPDILTGLERLL